MIFRWFLLEMRGLYFFAEIFREMRGEILTFWGRVIYDEIS